MSVAVWSSVLSRELGRSSALLKASFPDPYIFGCLPTTAVSSGITDRKLELAWWPVLLQTHMLDRFQSPRGRAVTCGTPLSLDVPVSDSSLWSLRLIHSVINRGCSRKDGELGWGSRPGTANGGGGRYVGSKEDSMEHDAACSKEIQLRAEPEQAFKGLGMNIN